MSLCTSLYQEHIALGARMVPFGGWDMPLHYGSQLEEHHAVRRDVGLFDVSHMAIVDLEGAEVRQFLQHLLANDVARLKISGQALYSCMLQEQGGVLDDLIAYFLRDDWYRLVVNAGTANKDLAWIQTQAANFTVNIRRRTDLAMLAIQGPEAATMITPMLPAELREAVVRLKPFRSAMQGDWFLSRTGYTGEDGFELMLPNGMAPALWRTLIDMGVSPCGLGARDTLRLEAGMNLYGTDMDETTTPLEAGLGWTVAWEPQERKFIGRAALEAQQAQKSALPKFVGLVLEGRGVLRNHQQVFANDTPVGIITSGSFSPTLKHAIALARIQASTLASTSLSQREELSYTVKILGKTVPVRVVKPPFVRHGRSVIE
jgi:aminomethyltransferase